MRIGFIEERGCRLLLFDFSGIKDAPESLAQIAAARQFVAQQPKRKELLVLVDVSRMRYDNEVLEAFRELTVHNEPWERAVAVFGIRGVGAVAFRAQNLMTGSRLKGFEQRDEAVQWLLEQEPKP